MLNSVPSCDHSGNVDQWMSVLSVLVLSSQLGGTLLECNNFFLFIIVFLRVPWAMAYAINTDWINDKASWLIVTVYVNRSVPCYLSYHPANSFLWSLPPQLFLPRSFFSMCKLKKAFIFKNIHFISLFLWEKNIFILEISLCYLFSCTIYNILVVSWYLLVLTFFGVWDNSVHVGSCYLVTCRLCIKLLVRITSVVPL